MKVYVNFIVERDVDSTFGGEVSRVPVAGDYLGLKRACYRVTRVLLQVNGFTWVWLEPIPNFYVPEHP